MNDADRAEAIPIPNALTLNSVGLAGNQFPAWVSMDSTDSIHVVDLGALTLRDLAPVLAAAGDDFVFIYDFGLSSYVEDGQGDLVEESLLTVAARESTEVLQSESGFPLVHSAELAELVGSVPHHQMSLVGTTDREIDLVDLWTQASGWKWTEGPVLVPIPAAGFFVDIDDCYVHAEFRDEAAALEAAALMLWTAVGTVAHQRDATGNLRQPTPIEIRAILGPDSRFVSSLSEYEVTDDGVSILFARKEWRLGEKIVPSHRLTCHYDGGWESMPLA